MDRHMAACFLLLLALAQLAGPAAACVYLYGARHEVPHYNYGYVGLDWPEEFATCSGTRQSPIHVPGHSSFVKIPDGDQSIFGYGKLESNATNIKVVNNGHTVQVVFPAGFAPNASVVVRGDANAKLVTKFSSPIATAQRVQITPAQFHFHTHSEHVIDGKEYALEMHIVNWVYGATLPGCGTGGCAKVVGIMFELAEDPDTSDEVNEFLENIFSVMPTQEGGTAYIAAAKTLDFDKILPADRSYITYEGSLTTPPCTEGILWHVLTTPIKITRAQMHQFSLAVGATECGAAPVAKRHLLSTGSTSSGGSSSSGAATTTTTKAAAEGFEVPVYAAVVNYRDIQDRDDRPIWFYAAPGLCDSQLNMLQSRSRVLKQLVFESNTSDAITLHQYNDIVEAGLTKEAGCAGITSAASRPAYSTVMQAVLAGLVLLWLL